MRLWSKCLLGLPHMGGPQAGEKEVLESLGTDYRYPNNTNVQSCSGRYVQTMLFKTSTVMGMCMSIRSPRERQWG